ncbi:hypothetical protein NIES39_M02680 [Arthrospira platensis NIES-39]|nr:hypothetical protein NIES39_M02680 [Arthrospira platensis NIES-39]
MIINNCRGGFWCQFSIPHDHINKPARLRIMDNCRGGFWCQFSIPQDHINKPALTHPPGD